jgi:eukaryotic-like serine/threonine-protein kinase
MRHSARVTAGQASAAFGPGRRIDDFRLIRLIGIGAFGEVHLAHDQKLGRRVAIKILKSSLAKPDERARFREEAQTTARFSHPHIVTIHAIGEVEDRPYLALEFVDGETLRDLMARGPVEPARALYIAQSVALALTDAHRHDVVHADLKPENVLIGKDGRVRVADFGLSHRSPDSDVSDTNGPGKGAGTPQYVAPEVWKGQPSTSASDVWSFAVLFLEMCMGRPPFDASAVGATAFDGDAKRLEIKSSPVAELVRDCLLLDPEKRPSARDVATRLEGALTQATTLTERPFRGLRAFLREDASYYFGRDQEIFNAAELIERHRRLVISGPSGVGKSSFAHAGLLPQLVGADVEIISLRPGARPFAALALRGSERDSTSSPDASPWDLAAEIDGRLRLTRRRLVLVVDQAEELFLSSDEGEREAFLSCLSALNDSDRSTVLITIRDDYLVRLLSAPQLARWLAQTMILGPLSRSALEQTVLRPLALSGYGLDPPALIERLVDDVVGEPAALPCLQFVCDRLWDLRDVDRRVFNEATYDELGGASGALAKHAATVLRSFSADELTAARRLLLALISAEGTRKTRAVTDVATTDVGREILARLVDARLLSSSKDPLTNEPIVELAHESLMATWPELAAWIGESQSDRRFLDQIENATALWMRRGELDNETWQGDALIEAKHEARNLPISGDARRFLEAGTRRAERDALSVRRRRIAVYAALALFALSALGFAIYRDRQVEVVRRAAANIGRSEIEVSLFELDESGERREVDVSLYRELTIDLLDPQASLAAPSAENVTVRKTAPLHFAVESPASPKILRVTGRHARGSEPCGASFLRLEALPTYERSREKASTLSFPIPTCVESSRRLVVVPAGEFWLSERQDEVKLRQLAGYAIDRTEVTIGAFRVFEELGPLTGYLPAQDIELAERNKGPDFPVVAINQQDAMAYCRFMGKRLPTIEEFQKAVRGPASEAGSKRLAPWGDDPPEGRCTMGLTEGSGPRAVAQMASDKSGYGIFDLAGNVSEWTESMAIGHEDTGFVNIFGANWDHPINSPTFRADFRNSRSPRYLDFGLGFRCAIDVDGRE